MLYNYEPFMNSPIQDSLYPLDSTGRASFEEYLRGNRNIPFTYKNKDLIIKMASSFYSTQIPKKSSSITIEKGQYRVGEAKNLTNPLRTVEVESYKISAFELTNYEFSKFIEATGYITDAERKKDALVFRLGKKEFEWVEDSTANWRFPNGISKGGIDYKMNHPVTCISYRDALAYCKWANVRLPTIDEWEIASRSDGQKGKYFFGKETDSIFNYANIWRGKNHATKDPREDYFTTSPVGSFLPNPKGLYDIYGNIFEFCSDLPPLHEGFKDVASTRGGSWWCSKYACGFFNSIDIGRVKKEASFSNNGFRIVELNLN